MRPRSILIATLVVSLAAAGCVNPEETQQDPFERGDLECGRAYVTTHWEGTPGADELAPVLNEHGYTWLPTQDPNVAQIDPPQAGVTGLAAFQPGQSAEDLVLSFEQESPTTTVADVETSAENAAFIINATFENATVTEWIVSAHTAPCGDIIRD